MSPPNSDVGKRSRKRKFSGMIATDKGGGRGGKASSSAGGADVYEEECVTILRAAIALCERTGVAPNKHICPEVYMAVRDTLPLSQKEVFNRLKTLHENLASGKTGGSDIVQKLSTDLWKKKDETKQTKKKKNRKKTQKVNEDHTDGLQEEVEDDGDGKGDDKDEKEEEPLEKPERKSKKKNKKTKKQKRYSEKVDNEEEEEQKAGLELFPSVADAATECVKDLGHHVSLENTMKRANLHHARALEGLWHKCNAKKISLQIEHLKNKTEVLKFVQRENK